MRAKPKSCYINRESNLVSNTVSRIDVIKKKKFDLILCGKYSEM